MRLIVRLGQPLAKLWLDMLLFLSLNEMVASVGEQRSKKAKRESFSVMSP